MSGIKAPPNADPSVTGSGRAYRKSIWLVNVLARLIVVSNAGASTPVLTMGSRMVLNMTTLNLPLEVA
jgi:hypothetical protein